MPGADTAPPSTNTVELTRSDLKNRMATVGARSYEPTSSRGGQTAQIAK
jgi:hypothetical protein